MRPLLLLVLILLAACGRTPTAPEMVCVIKAPTPLVIRNTAGDSVGVSYVSVTRCTVTRSR